MNLLYGELRAEMLALEVAFAGAQGADPPVNKAMWGPSEFNGTEAMPPTIPALTWLLIEDCSQICHLKQPQP